MYRPVLIAAPEIRPVTKDEAKQQCRVEHNKDDDLFDALIIAATDHLDGWTGILGRCLVQQTWRQDFDQFCYALRLPLAPVISITSVTYVDADDAEQTVAAANYSLLVDDLGPYVKLKDDFAVPSVRDEGPAVSVTYLAGYATESNVSSVPAAIKHAILMMVSSWYGQKDSLVKAEDIDIPGVIRERREFWSTDGGLPPAARHLIAPYRRIG